MNREELMRLLPHREGMLLIDEAILDEDGKARGNYAVRGGEWFLQGHFPGNPVVPGVILCEMMGQACCVLLGAELAGKTPYFTGMSAVRFRDMVRPGDLVESCCEITRQKGNFYWAKAKAEVRGKLVAQAELSFAVLGS
ncbi:MAG: beta-hydroxyacyl-ACP dehydratase [Christensenellaceae bacterium]|jgi:3-hydroxyacyl-[acyl-carrier-protein] dehydratase|nr:beta-hydroxyacyl-ACP dehydratase [Christensenellaceae bacterium]